MSYRVDNMANCLSQEYDVNVVSPILESSYPSLSETGNYRILRFDLRILQKIRAHRALFRILFIFIFALCMVKVRKKTPHSQICLVQSEQQLALLPAVILSFFCRTKLIVDDILSRNNYYKEHLGFFEIFIHAAETILVKRCSLVIATNDRVAREIKDSARLETSKVRIVPNGVKSVNPDVSFEIADLSKKDIVFVGSMYSEQNRRAVNNLLQIFPSVLSEVNNARLVIIGGPLSLLNKRLNPFPENLKNSIQFLGYLSEIEKEKYLLAASVCVLPFDLKDSLIGGIRLKALDFLSYGKIVVSTPTGIEGIRGAVSGENMIIADNLEFFRECLIDVLKHPEKYEQVQKNALKLASNYEWLSVLKGYSSILKEMMRNEE